MSFPVFLLYNLSTAELDCYDFTLSVLLVSDNVHETFNCSRAFASNVKCMYSSVPGHIVDCSEFI